MRSGLTTIAACLIVAGCGGGGSDSSSGGQPPVTPPPPAANAAQGVYAGTTNNGRSINGIVLDNGTYYFLYSQGTTIDGVIEGTGTANNGSFTSTDAKDFNFQGEGLLPATISASYTAKQTLKGSIAYTNPASVTTFTTTYDTSYDQTPSLTAVAGNYAGQAIVNNASSTANVSVAGNAVTLTGPGTCKANGTIAPHAAGNVYDIALTFTADACSVQNLSMTGSAFLTSSGDLIIAALDADRVNGVLFNGNK